MSGLSCSMQDLWSSLGHTWSLDSACGIQFLDQVSDQGPLHWELRVSSIGPPRKSLRLLVRTPDVGLKTHTNLGWPHLSLITSAETSFPDKVTFTGVGVLRGHFWRGTPQFTKAVKQWGWQASNPYWQWAFLYQGQSRGRGCSLEKACKTLLTDLREEMITNTNMWEEDRRWENASVRTQHEGPHTTWSGGAS